MQQIHVDTLAEWHQFSLDNAAFQSIPYKIILHRFILRLMSVLSSRAKHNKKYQKPYRSICNVASIRNNGDREGKKGGGKVWERWIYLYHISSEIVIEKLLTIILTIILLIVNVGICRGFFQYGKFFIFIFFFWKKD